MPCLAIQGSSAVRCRRVFWLFSAGHARADVRRQFPSLTKLNELVQERPACIRMRPQDRFVRLERARYAGCVDSRLVAGHTRILDDKGAAGQDLLHYEFRSVVSA